LFLRSDPDLGYDRIAEVLGSRAGQVASRV